MNAHCLKSKPKKLIINIAPPWYHTAWFRVVAFCIIGFVTWMGIRLYIRQKLLKQKRLLEQERTMREERDRIASELHDDVGSGLSIIQFLTESVLDDETNEKSRLQILQIANHASKIIENMSEIIWALNAKNDTLENLVNYLRRYAHNYLALSHYTLDFKAPEIFNKKNLTGKFRRNIHLIFKESLHNIVKHAEASLVEVEVVLQEDIFQLNIRDNGKGMQVEDNIGRMGNGLENMKQRAKAMKGTLEIKSILGRGTSVELKINYLRACFHFIL